MSGVVIQIFNGDEHNELPRFLNRDETGAVLNGPPPLPSVRWEVRVGRMIAAVPRRGAILIAALVVVVPAAAALVADAGWRKTDAPRTATAADALIAVSEVRPMTEGLEARLGYGGNLASTYREAPATGPTDASGTTQQIAAAVAATPASELAGSVGLLILRNLPENATFTVGEPAGKGEWIMAAGDPNQLDETLGEGFDKPVAADVEMISHAGQTLGVLHVELHKDGAAVAAAEAAPGPPVPEVPASSVSTVQPEPKPQDVKTSETKSGEVKPAKRTRHVHVRTKYKVARADRGHKRRAKPTDDRVKAKAAGDADTGDDPQTSDDAGKDEAEDKTPKGPIAKFFTWLKGGSTGPAAEDADSNSRAAMLPQ